VLKDPFKKGSANIEVAGKLTQKAPNFLKNKETFMLWLKRYDFH
jgi:hypothetical protein